jgi:hypothetical protein
MVASALGAGLSETGCIIRERHDCLLIGCLQQDERRLLLGGEDAVFGEIASEILDCIVAISAPARRLEFQE